MVRFPTLANLECNQLAKAHKPAIQAAMQSRKYYERAISTAGNPLLSEAHEESNKLGAPRFTDCMV